MENSPDSKNTLYVAGGLALIVLGTGLILTHPGIRQSLTIGMSTILPGLREPLRKGGFGLLSDIERYLKIKSM